MPWAPRWWAWCSASDETIPDAEKDLPRNLCPLIKSSYGFAKTEQASLLLLLRSGGGRDHLRRQEEDV